MPRKQNGFGNSKSLAFKGSGRVDRGKGKGAAGYYPSSRGFGAAVHRTVIEQYDLDSDWVKWRKGYEYYNQAAWYKLETYDPVDQEYEETRLKSKLYQGTDYEIDVEFTGYKFATKNADSNNHYVMKRTTVSEPDLGTIRTVLNDPFQHAEQQRFKEVWTQINPGADAPLLLRMIGERITDGTVEGTISNLLNAQAHPALYVGKTHEQQTMVKVSIPTISINYEPGVQPITNYQDLVGKIVYIPNFYVDKDIALVDKAEFKDSDYFFEVNVEDFVPSMELRVLDPGDSVLPPSLLDLNDLPSLFKTPSADYTITGNYLYRKEDYQRYFGKQYLTAELVESEVTDCSYTVMPFKILGVEENLGQLVFTSVPFDSEFRLNTALTDGTIVFADWSFIRYSIDTYNGEYYHAQGAPGEALWRLLDTDVDPWMDELFDTQNASPLRPATVYTCSCPNHSHAQLRAPQSTTDEGTRKVNRQIRYPLPTVMSKDDYSTLASAKVAGITSSWESREHRLGFKMCKHSIAAMFIERLKVKEPNSYPSVETREKFEAKLNAEIAEVADEFGDSYRRGGITSLEVVFALAQGLNLDDTELAYVILNSNF